jgi:hypothetical protein
MISILEIRKGKEYSSAKKKKKKGYVSLSKNSDVQSVADIMNFVTSFQVFTIKE